jgi:hypothetical protein
MGQAVPGSSLAVENARGLGRHLAQWLVARGEVVLDVPSTAIRRSRPASASVRLAWVSSGVDVDREQECDVLNVTWVRGGVRIDGCGSLTAIAAASVGTYTSGLGRSSG